jgi:DNA invertase Pin-like site-specific DNA recombinase
MKPIANTHSTSTNTNPKLIPAVSYLRRSSDSKSQEASIPAQRATVQKYAVDKGYRIVREYVDDAVSGDDTENREAFLRMVSDARELRDFEVILCWDQDRFGRFDPLEAGYYIHPLRQLGVCLVTVAQGRIDWENFEGRLLYTVAQEGKHAFLRDLSRNVVRGKLQAAEQGGWLGRRPYAYRIEGPKYRKQLVIDDMAQVRVVQRIFKEFVEEGRSMNNIAQRLNAEGYVSPHGTVNGWRYDSVKAILENPAYAGDYVGLRTSNAKYHRVTGGKVEKVPHKRKMLRNRKEAWIIRRDTHEAIIDRETFAKAQAILAKGKWGKPKYAPEDNPYVLSCLLTCGRCGSTLHGRRIDSHLHYQCGNRDHNGPAACDGTTVREDRVLYSIADYLDKEFLSLDGVELAWKADRRELTQADLPEAFAKVKRLVSPPKQSGRDRSSVAKQVKALSEKLDRARRNLVLLDPENIPTAQEEVRRMEAERGELEAELRKRPPSDADINAEATEVLRSLYWLRLLFVSAANESGGVPYTDGEYVPEAEGYYAGLRGAQDPALRRYLSRIAGITIHTSIKGTGIGVRHTFLGGEIAFRKLGDGTGVVPEKS